MHLRSRYVPLLFLGIFLLAGSLRVYPALLNHDANDNHIKVIRIIASENRIPEKEEPECPQCYHPKFYHFIAGKIAANIPFEFKNKLFIIGQFLSVLAGLATLGYIFSFLKNLTLTPTTRFFTFLLVALNPALIGIHIQSTNDSWVIFFSTAALYHLYHFLTKNLTRDFIFMTLFIIFAALSKGSGLIIFIGICIILILRILPTANDLPKLWESSIALVMFIGITLSGIILFGPYDEYLRNYGSPIVINKEKSPPPKFLEKTYVESKTGIVSIYDAYFTFRLFDLLREPYLDRGRPNGEFQPARESLWTQLYARTHFIQYEGRPNQWFTKWDHPIYSIGRVIYVLALVPLGIFLFGLFISTKKHLFQFLKNPKDILKNNVEWIWLFVCFAFFAFIVKFTFEYREFSSMKPIYLFPALLAFIYFFAIGLNTILARIQNYFTKNLVNFSLITLAIFYIIDILVLIKTLS